MPKIMKTDDGVVLTSMEHPDRMLDKIVTGLQAKGHIPSDEELAQPSSSPSLRQRGGLRFLRRLA